MNRIIKFIQKGTHIFEGEIWCEVCGYKGNGDLSIAIAHKNGQHNVK